MSFVFSADGHVVEPKDLFEKNLPASMKKHGIRSERQGEHMCTMAGEKVLHRMRLQKKPDGSEERASLGHQPKGHADLDARLEDMQMEGVDAEIVFPSTCLWTYGIEDIDTELATAQIYNDWNNKYFSGHLDKFIRCGVLPVRDFKNTELEMKRLAEMGFTSAMIPAVSPTGMPKYNDEAWDPVFELGGELGIVFVLHTGTGLDTVQPERHAGGAVINYTNQACDAWQTIMYMVAGGLLDRHPKAKVAAIESGASWLAALCERMDEVYHAHAAFVRPKLSLNPSEIVARQVSASFQYDRGCIMTRSITGTKALMWGADYPHAEGTFPHSKKVLASLFDGIDISEQEKADILGGNAARLFRLQRPEFQNAA